MKVNTRVFAWVLAGLAFSSGVMAQTEGAGDKGKEYTPPSTPELYDVHEKLEPAYVRVKKVKSHPYLGLGVGFGSSRLDGGNGTPNVSWNITAEGGYVKALSSWSRVDFGLEAFNGSIGNSENTIDIQIGGLAKAGYGYNISENLYGLLRLGYGLASGKYTGPLGDKNPVAGSILQGAIQLIVPTEAPLDILVGFFVTQFGFSDRGTYNTYEGRIGLRYRL